LSGNFDYGEMIMKQATSYFSCMTVTPRRLPASMPVLVAALSALVGLSGCAGADFRPVVDMSGHTQAQYDEVLVACQRDARGVRNNTDIAEDVGIGALGGAALGVVGGAIAGNPGLGAGVGALVGAVGGGGYKEIETENREETVVKNCLSSHGFTVLGEALSSRRARGAG
jgi:outer membrane lipoprotein SlyB